MELEISDLLGEEISFVEWAACFEGLKAVKDVEERSPMTRLSTCGSSGSWERWNRLFYITL
jgi:hypothetical protein